MNTENTSVGKTSRRQGRVIGWSDVSRCLEDPKTRARVLSKYKAAGFTADEFGRLVAAKTAMMDALTGAEDWLELDHPGRKRERDGIKQVRRGIELGLGL